MKVGGRGKCAEQERSSVEAWRGDETRSRSGEKKGTAEIVATPWDMKGRGKGGMNGMGHPKNAVQKKGKDGKPIGKEVKESMARRMSVEGGITALTASILRRGCEEAMRKHGQEAT